MDPVTRYARNGDVHIAYQVFGEGPFDLVVVPAWVNQLEHVWLHPLGRRFRERLGTMARTIVFDRRGSGLSDPMVEAIPLEEQVEDIAAVMDAVGSSQAAVFAQSEGTALAALFAAARPERVRALAMLSPMPCLVPRPGYEWPLPPQERAQRVDEWRRTWGQGNGIDGIAPRTGQDPEVRRWYATLERLSVPPGMLGVINAMLSSTDVRAVLPSIQAPTLIAVRPGDANVDPRHAAYALEHIPGARLVEIPGDETLILSDGLDELLDETEEFLTGTRRAPEPDRVLATVLFTDIVGSTRRASELGDGAWRALLDRHDRIVRAEVERHRGRAVKSLGDGFLATFDGPARAVRCAQALAPALSALGIEVRAGVHTGEIELLGDDVGGIGVHIGARVAAQAQAGEVLASRTVRDLVVGSGLEFEERETVELRGVPGEWELHVVRR